MRSCGARPPSSSGDVGNEQWRSALNTHRNRPEGDLQQQPMVGNGNGDIARRADLEMMQYDNLSVSSYGSHKNRNFNVGSHKGSLRSLPRNDDYHHHDEAGGDEEAGGADWADGSKAREANQMNGGAAPPPPTKHTRTVVIDENNIDTRSISEEDSEAAQVRNATPATLYKKGKVRLFSIV